MMGFSFRGLGFTNLAQTWPKPASFKHSSAQLINSGVPMQDDLEDAAILAGLSFSSCLLFGLLWLFLGPMGIAGTLAGYGLGIWIYLMPSEG